MDCKFILSAPKFDAWLEKKFVGNLADIVHLPFSLRKFLACLDASRDRKRKKGIVFRTYVSFDFIVDDEDINFTSNKAKSYWLCWLPTPGDPGDERDHR